MTLLLWLVRLLVLLLVIRLLMRLMTSRRQPDRARTPGRSSVRERIGGALVRDPHCGTYVPKSNAIAVGTGDRAIYFCSAGCRDAHSAAERQPHATSYVK